MKVCLVNKNTVNNDKRALQEATILTQAGLEVVIIGILGAGYTVAETKNGFYIKRVKPPLGIAHVFLNNFYLPIQSRLPHRLHKWARISFGILSLLLVWLVWLDGRLRNIITYSRLFRAMLSERPDYYHSHSPFTLLAVTFLAAKIRGVEYVSDFNDILVIDGLSSLGNYYEQESAWGQELKESEVERIRATIRLVRNDVSSILDIGCGDGRITNHLANTCSQVVGADTSRVALRHVRTDRMIASVTGLPFKDSSFDLVLATELLEHLPWSEYLIAIREIKRVASNWMLIGVPLREQLTIAYARCPCCKFKFHGNYHFRSFNENDMHKLFAPEYKLTEMEQCGGQARTYAPRLLWIKHHIGGVWARTRHTVCPRCNRHLFPGNLTEGNAVTKFCDERNQKRYGRDTKKTHVAALYRKNGST